MVLEKLIEDAAKLTPVQAGEIKETSEFRDRDELGSDTTAPRNPQSGFFSAPETAPAISPRP